MALSLALSADNYVIELPILEWSAFYLDATPPQGRLVASIEADRHQTPIQLDARTATSLAMAMDVRVAIRLYEQLGDRIREMHWQQYVTGGRPI